MRVVEGAHLRQKQNYLDSKQNNVSSPNPLFYIGQGVSFWTNAYHMVQIPSKTEGLSPDAPKSDVALWWARPIRLWSIW